MPGQTKKTREVNTRRESSPVTQAFVGRALEHLEREGETQAEMIAALAADLSSLGDAAAAAALSELARQGRERTVPLLMAAASGPSQATAVAATAALGLVRDPAAVTALLQLVESDRPKAVRKAARRSLFRLQGAGVPVQREERIAARPTGRRAVAAKISNIDDVGSRLIALAVEAPLNAADLVAMVVSDERGIVDGSGSRMSRSELPRRLERLMPKSEGLRLVDAPPDYCREAILAAHELNRARARQVPSAFYHWQASIGQPAVHYERELIYEEIPPAHVRWNPQLLEESGHLLELPEFLGWWIPEEVAAEAAQGLSRVRESQIVLPGRLQETEQKRTIDRLVDSFFDEQTRLKYKRRLEQTAYVLQRVGRGLQARMAVAAALALDPSSPVPLREQPFPMAMAELSLEMIGHKERRKRERPGGLILPPR